MANPMPHPTLPFIYNHILGGSPHSFFKIFADKFNNYNIPRTAKHNLLKILFRSHYFLPAIKFFFTDGSKSDIVGSGLYFPSINTEAYFSKQSCSSICLLECPANLEVNRLASLRSQKKFLIVSDSISVLSALQTQR